MTTIGSRAMECSRANAGLVLAGLLLIAAARPVGAADVLTQHNDNARTGVNGAETVLTTAKVKADSFGRLWTLYVDGQVVAQPLYVSQLHVDTSGNPNTPLVQGTFNAVVVATMHNTIYVYDADAENRLPDGKTKPLWATWLGPPRPGGKDIDMWSTNDPEWGILGTPVIDPQKATLWAVTWNDDGGTFRYRLHTLNLKDGTARQPAIAIGGDPPGSGQAVQVPRRLQPLYTETAHRAAARQGRDLRGVRRRRQPRLSVRLRRRDPATEGVLAVDADRR